MAHLKISDLTKEVDRVIARVEKGETFIITKEGKPVAELHPLTSKIPHWKKKVIKVVLPNGASAQSIIEEERNLR